MRLKSFLPAIAAMLFLSCSTAALAHPGHGDAVGFFHGVGHPLTGVDHMLAMLMVGLFAVQMGGRAVWRLPAAFMAFLALGSIVGLSGVTPSTVEAAIGLSVLLLGLALALQLRWSPGVATGLVVAAALVHGHAHDAEAAGGVSFAYVSGFLLSTALLHGVGIAAGLGLRRAAPDGGRRIMRIAGAATAATGALLLTY